VERPASISGTAGADLDQERRFRRARVDADIGHARHAEGFDRRHAVGAHGRLAVHLDPDGDRAVALVGDADIDDLAHGQAAEADIGRLAQPRDGGKADVVIGELLVQLDAREPQERPQQGARPASAKRPIRT
jgi:hypothetical protein